MYKVIIIDDEPLARDIIKNYLSSFQDFEIVAQCGNGFDGLKAIQLHQPHLVFLDVQMPKLTGFELLELLDPPVPDIIFTTAFDTYAIKAFETHALDYLLKPFGKDRFAKAIYKWLEFRKISMEGNSKEGNSKEGNIKEENIREGNTRGLNNGFSNQGMNLSTPEEQQRVVVNSGNTIRVISVGDIHYFEAHDDYVKITIEGDCFLKKKTMNYFEQILNPSQFVRIHRSFIIQLNQLTAIKTEGKENHSAVLKNGTVVPISKTGMVKLNQLLNLHD